MKGAWHVAYSTTINSTETDNDSHGESIETEAKKLNTKPTQSSTTEPTHKTVDLPQGHLTHTVKT